MDRGRVGGGMQPYAASDGADGAAIPAASRKMVQSLKEILSDRSEGEIYATLCDCGMDPDMAIERLLLQDTFHEVKRGKKKETKASQETRPRPFQKSIYRGYKAGPDRNSIGVFKGPIKRESELNAPLNSSSLDIKTGKPTEAISASGNIGHAHANDTTSQPPSQVKHGRPGIPPKDATLVDMLPPVEGMDVEASSMSAEAQDSSTLDVKESGIEASTESLTISGEPSTSVKAAANEYFASATNNTKSAVQLFEVTRGDFLDATNHTEYNLSSTSDNATSSAVLQGSASCYYQQENLQFQTNSPPSSFMI